MFQFKQKTLPTELLIEIHLNKFFSDFAKIREKETNIDQSQNLFENSYLQQTKHQLRHNINGKVVFELQ